MLIDVRMSISTLSVDFAVERLCHFLQHVKKNRDPRWEEEFTFMLEEPPIKDRLHVEVLSSSSRIGLLHPKVFKSTLYHFKFTMQQFVKKNKGSLG